MFTVWLRLPFSLTILSLLLSPSLAAEDVTFTRPNLTPDHLVVLRVSDAFLNSIMGDKNIDRLTDVRETILGTSIYGRARTIGNSGVKLVESQNDATFYITLNGTVYSRTVGYNGPAIIYSRSVTKFTAYRKVFLKPGQGFYAIPSQVTAHTETYLEGIGSSRGGLIGRIVLRRARRLEAERHAEATAIAQQKAQRRIEIAFDRSSEQRLARLNNVADYRSLATAALRSTGRIEPNYACSTTPHYLQIAARFGGGGPAVKLPASHANLGTPIEIWVHDSLWDKSISGGLVPGPFWSLIRSQLRTRQLQDWQIVQFQNPKSNTVKSAPSLASKIPSTRPRTTTRRIWTSGKHTADADFLALDGNMVRLRRNTGVRTSIPIELLSPVDRVWIQNHLASR